MASTQQEQERGGDGGESPNASFSIPRWVRVYIVPAAVLQSVLIGGGYGTGREAVEFVTQAGPAGGLLAVLWFFLLITVVVGATFEFARIFKTYDYRHYFKMLLGPGWWLYEVLLILLLLLVFAVVISAASTLALNWFGLPVWLTTAGVIGLTMLILYLGTAVVQGILAVWSVAFSLFLASVILFNLDTQALGAAWVESEWAFVDSLKGFQFGFYNIAAIPLLLYTATAIRTRRESLLAALCAGVATALPALLMHAGFVPLLPGVLNEPLPMMAFIDALDVGWLLYAYAVLVIGIVVQTAIGGVEGIIQRVDGVRIDGHKTPLSTGTRGLIGGAVMVISTFGSSFGVIALIGAGYGTLAWGFMLVYAIPALTFGIWKITTRNRANR